MRKSTSIKIFFITTLTPLLAYILYAIAGLTYVTFNELYYNLDVVDSGKKYMNFVENVFHIKYLFQNYNWPYLFYALLLFMFVNRHVFFSLGFAILTLGFDKNIIHNSVFISWWWRYNSKFASYLLWKETYEYMDTILIGARVEHEYEGELYK